MNVFIKLISRVCLRNILFLLTSLFLISLLLHFVPGSPWDDESPLHDKVRSQLSQDDFVAEGNPNIVVNSLYLMKRILTLDFGDSLKTPGLQVQSRLIESISVSVRLASLCFLFLVLELVFFLGLSFHKKMWRAPIAAFLRLFLVLPLLLTGPLMLFLIYKSQTDAGNPAALMLIFAAVVLSLRPCAQLYFLVSRNLDVFLEGPQSRYLLSMGFPTSLILWKYGLKNSLLPALNSLAPLLVGMFSGSVIIEILFSQNGAGLLFVESLSARDWPVLLGVTSWYALLVFICYSLSDLLIVALDPRLKRYGVP